MTDAAQADSTVTIQITDKEAIARLDKLGKEQLGLQNALSAYEVTVDKQTTVVDGSECYKISLTDGRENPEETVGVFCVTIDGGSIYRLEPKSGAYRKINLETSNAIIEESPEKVITEAMKVYAWFEVAPLEADRSVPIQEANGVTYYKVRDGRYDTYNELYAYLRSIFSQEISDRLINNGVYHNIEGHLYHSNGGRGADATIQNVSYSLQSSTDRKQQYVVTVSYTQDQNVKNKVKKLTFIRENLDGQWIFTQFPFFW